MEVISAVRSIESLSGMCKVHSRIDGWDRHSDKHSRGNSRSVPRAEYRTCFRDTLEVFRRRYGKHPRDIIRRNFRKISQDFAYW